jgi:hypothetical protein
MSRKRTARGWARIWINNSALEWFRNRNEHLVGRGRAHPIGHRTRQGEHWETSAGRREDGRAVADVAGIDGEAVQWPPAVVAHPASRGEAHGMAASHGRERGVWVAMVVRARMPGRQGHDSRSGAAAGEARSWR